MRQFAFGIAVSVTLLGAEFASAQSTFNVLVCSSNATDIVMTDTEGRVLETWRGEFKPGDTVRLGTLQRSPAKALPLDFLRLCPKFAFSDLYRDLSSDCYGRYYSKAPLPQSTLWSVPAGEAEKPLRLVLFLRKKSILGQAPFWWEPASTAETPGQTVGFLGSRWAPPPPEPDKNDFTGSITLVEGGRVLGCQHPGGFTDRHGHLLAGGVTSLQYTGLTPVANSLIPVFPQSRPEEKPQPKPIESLRTATYFGTFISDPPPTPAKVSICETSVPTHYVVLRERLFRFRR